MSLNKRAQEYGNSLSSEYLNAVTDTVVESLTVPPLTSAVLVSVVGAEPIKYRTDGIDPTSTVGHPLSPGGYVELFFDDIVRFRAVCGTAASNTDLFVTYFGER